MLNVVKKSQFVYEVIERDGLRYYIQHVNRFFLFSRGFVIRQNRLQNEYLLRNVVLPKVASNLLFVDVGANIGELAFYAGKNALFYIGIEPDPNVFPVLEKNVEVFSVNSKYKILNIALGSDDGKVDFYLATDKADSSVVKPSSGHTGRIEVDLKRLDSLNISKLGIPFLLKIEAEGFEESVLRGGFNTIREFNYVVIDCGPENGLENTMAESLNFIFELGFTVVEVNLLRGTVLFKNNNFRKV